MTIRPILPIIGAAIGFYIGHKKQKSTTTKLVYTVVGGVLAYIVAYVIANYFLNDFLNSGMTQEEADKAAKSICQFEKDLAYFKANDEKTAEFPSGYEAEIADFTSRIEKLKKSLEMGKYSYVDCKAVKK